MTWRVVLRRSKTVPKTLVYRLARWRNARAPVIPERVFVRPPSAELAPDQKDEDNLPPYAVLDPILERYVERDRAPEDIVAAGFDPPNGGQGRAPGGPQRIQTPPGRPRRAHQPPRLRP